MQENGNYVLQDREYANALPMDTKYAFAKIRPWYQVDVRLEYDRCKPKRANPTDAGADLVSTTGAIIWPGEQHMLNTGVAMRIPEGWVGLVFNRSSQGKIGMSIPNSVGVIDSDYRGDIKVLLKNNGTEGYEIKAFETRIAQIVIVPIMLAQFEESGETLEDWLDTKRGAGGFGSTGV